MAAYRQRSRGVRGLAAPLAGGPPAERGWPAHSGGPGRRTRRDELGVLPGGGPAAAVDGGRDRVCRYGAPGCRRDADRPQRRSTRAHDSGRRYRHRDPHQRTPARVCLRLRQLRAVRAVHHPRPPDRHGGCPGGRAERCRPARGGHVCRGGRSVAVGPSRRSARLQAPRPVAGRGRSRRVLVGDSLCRGSAGDGTAAPGRVLAHAGAAAGVRHHHRRGRAASGSHRSGRRRHRSGGAGRRDPSGQGEETAWIT